MGSGRAIRLYPALAQAIRFAYACLPSKRASLHIAHRIEAFSSLYITSIPAAKNDLLL